MKRSENVRHGSRLEKTHTKPSVMPSRSASFRAASSLRSLARPGTRTVARACGQTRSWRPPGAAGRQDDYSQRTTVTNGHEQRDDLVAAAGRARNFKRCFSGPWPGFVRQRRPVGQRSESAAARFSGAEAVATVHRRGRLRVNPQDHGVFAGPGKPRAQPAPSSRGAGPIGRRPSSRDQAACAT